MTEIVFDHEDFNFETLDEELKADEQCRRLLQQLYGWLQQQGLTPEQASELAYSADYYLRDYVLDFLRRNALRPRPGQVRYFAANWYITRTLEPEISILERHLEAIVCLYRFIQSLHLISAAELQQVVEEAAERNYYQQRIASFCALAGEGYDAWERECRLEQTQER